MSNRNIVQFFGLYTSESGDKYIVNELLSKGSLLDLLRSHAETITVVDLLTM